MFFAKHQFDRHNLNSLLPFLTRFGNFYHSLNQTIILFKTRLKSTVSKMSTNLNIYNQITILR